MAPTRRRPAFPAGKGGHQRWGVRCHRKPHKETRDVRYSSLTVAISFIFGYRKISRLKVAADLWATFWSKVGPEVVPAAVVGSVFYINSRL